MFLNSVVGRRVCSTVDLKAWVRRWVHVKRDEWLRISGKRHQIGHLDFQSHRLLTEGLEVTPVSNQYAKILAGFGDDLSRLVHLRAGQKPISDARTATYVILSTGSGPGGRWFKSIRPDHFF
jgi:hypothetical protein